MYTVSKGPSKIVAKTRRGLSQNYEKFETIKESGKRSSDLNSPEKNNVPRPVFQTTRKSTMQTKQIEEEVITPQHEEIIRYINDSWNIVMAQNPYDTAYSTNEKVIPAVHTDSNNNSNPTTPNGSISSVSSSSCCSSFSSTPSSLCSSPANSPQPSASIYCVEPPSPVLSDFKPFDLESWWGRRLFNNITKSL